VVEPVADESEPGPVSVQEMVPVALFSVAVKLMGGPPAVADAVGAPSKMVSVGVG